MGTCSTDYLLECAIWLSLVFGGFAYLGTRNYVTLVDERPQGSVIYVAEKGSAELHLFPDSTARLYTRNDIEQPVVTLLGRYYVDGRFRHFFTGACTGKVQPTVPETLHVPDACIGGVRVWRRK